MNWLAVAACALIGWLSVSRWWWRRKARQYQLAWITAELERHEQLSAAFEALQAISADVREPGTLEVPLPDADPRLN